MKVGQFSVLALFTDAVPVLQLSWLDDGGTLSFISVVSCELTIRCAGVQPVMLDPALYRFSSIRDLVTIATTAEIPPQKQLCRYRYQLKSHGLCLVP
jgi:hypothetical protein